jgi:hypothetical protein
VFVALASSLCHSTDSVHDCSSHEGHHCCGGEHGMLPSSMAGNHLPMHTSAYVSIRQHTSAYVSIRHHTLPSSMAGNHLPIGLPALNLLTTSV